MYQLKCDMFTCELRGFCLFEGSCEKCKIERCKICMLRRSCKTYKEKKKNESKV